MRNDAFRQDSSRCKASGCAPIDAFWQSTCMYNASLCFCTVHRRCCMFILRNMLRLSSFLVASTRRPLITYMSFSSLPKIPSLLEADRAVELAAAGQRLKFLDGSWHMDKTRKPLEEFEAERITNASYIDIDEISDKSTTLPHMIPSVPEFEAHMSKAGVSNDDHVVVYATRGCFSAARVWWMMRLYGHENVSILNGGLPAWKAAGGAVESGPVNAPSRTSFKAKFNPNLVVKAEDVLAVVNSGAAQIVDARSLARFMGQVPEPRPGLVGGHIPGSLCLPFTTLLREDDVTRFKSPMELKNAVQEAGVVLGANLVFTCGSGVTAAVLYFSLHLLGIDMNKLALYDGSWTEWAQRPDLPKVNPTLDAK